MSAPARVLLVGANGRMGKAITAAVERSPGLTITGELERGDSIEPIIGECDVVIDFSAADATESICRACAENRKPLVLGTTGHNAEQKERVREAAQRIAIVFASNFSVGANALYLLTRQAAQLLGEEFDYDIVEMHHRMKKDAPSGTAKQLVKILKEVSVDQEEVVPLSVRAGDIVGEHSVIFTGPGERVELIHRASSRDAFAFGALRAARWMIDQPAGLYSMEDVLGERAAK